MISTGVTYPRLRPEEKLAGVDKSCWFILEQNKNSERAGGA
jgi:hypothetical protein